ncbi:MAG: DUF2780 domain-containing protein [Pseudomonadota bacterium]
MEHQMQDLINRVAQNVGIDASIAEPAIGAILKMLMQALPDDIAGMLSGALPGADDLIARADQGGEGGGALGGLGGMVGGALSSLTGGSGGGQLMELLGQLQGMGLDTDQSKAVGGQVLGFIKENAPAEVTQAIQDKVPGISELL